MSASVIRAMLPFLYVGSLGYYNDSADRDYVRARELMKKNGRWMQTDPLWPAEAPYRYVGCSPLAHIDPSGLKCQAPNPCSDLKGAQGACIALLCSFKTVDDMIKYLKKAINIDPKDFQGIEKLVRSLWGKKFSPEECCKKATGAPGFGSMEWLIKLLCTNSWFWGKSRPGLPVPRNILAELASEGTRKKMPSAMLAASSNFQKMARSIDCVGYAKRPVTELDYHENSM